MLINLTKNALKFSSNKSVTIRAGYNPSIEQLQVLVEDKGRGIAKEDVEKLFCLFGKLEDTNEENVEGIGMGLTICKRIVDRCGGHIGCYSAG